MANTFAQATTFSAAVTLSSTASASAGTVAAPSIYLSTDTGTGIYRSAANELAVTVSGTQRTRTTSAGFIVTGAISATTSITATGALSGDTLSIGGGFGSTGLSVDAAGLLSTNGAVRTGDSTISATIAYDTNFINNLYYNSGWKYYGNGPGLYMSLGTWDQKSDFVWYTGAKNVSGAGAASTQTERMRLSEAGLLTCGTATFSSTVTCQGALAHTGSTAGFFNTAATTKPTVTGSRASNAALASLCTALATLGLITNSTS